MKSFSAFIAYALLISVSVGFSKQIPSNSNVYSLVMISTVGGCGELVKDVGGDKIIKTDYSIDNTNIRFYTRTTSEFYCSQIKEDNDNLTLFSGKVESGDLASLSMARDIASRAKSAFDTYHPTTLKLESYAKDPEQGIDYETRAINAYQLNLASVPETPVDSISQANLTSIPTTPVDSATPPVAENTNGSSNGPLTSNQTTVSGSSSSKGPSASNQTTSNVSISPQSVYSTFVSDRDKLLVETTLSGGYVMGVKCPDYNTILPLFHGFDDANLKSNLDEIVNSPLATRVNKALSAGSTKIDLLSEAETAYKAYYDGAQTALKGLYEHMNQGTINKNMQQVRQGMADGSLRFNREVGGQYLKGYIALEYLVLKFRVAVDYMKCELDKK